MARTFQYRLVLLFCLILLAVGYSSYVAISNTVAEQSRLQQQSIGPIFALVNQELLKPLLIAETVAKAHFFRTHLDKTTLNKDQITTYLQELEQSFDLVFFIASEKARLQLMSSGREFELNEEDVEWYFEAKKQNKNLIADLGQSADIHLYFDVSVYNQNDDFLGFVGVGKSLKSFVEQFTLYRQQYGYDFLFVNEDQEVILSSIPNLVTSDDNIITLSQLPWFQKLNIASLNQTEWLNELVNIDDNEFLLSKINVAELSWNVLLLSPLDQRQAQIKESFLKNGGLAIGLIVAVFMIASLLVWHAEKELQSSIGYDALTGLANRKFIFSFYKRLIRKRQLISVIMVDVDHFKQVNDTHGHNAGDEVLKSVANVLGEQFRKQDIVGRWGGEEFIVLLPETDAETAVAIAERARTELQNVEVSVEQETIQVTVSFGVTQGYSSNALTHLIEKADQALYRAKNSGRNKVEAKL